MNRQKIEFTKTSIEKSDGFKNDPLIAFIILWIGFNALYDDDKGEEKDKVFRYLSAHKDTVKELLKNKSIELAWIVDFINRTPQHSRISAFIKTCSAFLKPEASDSVKHFFQLIYQIRNNMFHAEKSWNQDDEAKLLKMVNPIIKYMLSKFIEKELG